MQTQFLLLVLVLGDLRLVLCIQQPHKQVVLTSSLQLVSVQYLHNHNSGIRHARFGVLSVLESQRVHRSCLHFSGIGHSAW